MDSTRLCPVTPKPSSSAECLPSKSPHIWDKFLLLSATSVIKRGGDREGDLVSMVQNLHQMDPSSPTYIRINQNDLIFFGFFGIFVCIVILLVVRLVTLISCAHEAVKLEHLSSACTSHCLGHF